VTVIFRHDIVDIVDIADVMFVRRAETGAFSAKERIDGIRPREGRNSMCRAELPQ
jgi:hypothetical protein